MNDDRVVELLEDLVKWTKATSYTQVKNTLEELLPTPELKLAFKLSNGKRTIREVSRLSGINQGTLSREWKKWIRACIAEAVSAKRGKRARSLFSLDDLGIESPKVPKATAKKTAKKPLKESENKSGA